MHTHTYIHTYIGLLGGWLCMEMQRSDYASYEAVSKSLLMSYIAHCAKSAKLMS